jgi:hypothetical protein
MLYGSSVHKFAETYVQTRDMVQAMCAAHNTYRSKPAEEGKKDWLTINHLTQTCAKMRDWIDQDNVEYYKNPVDGVPLCEVKFPIPYKVYPHCEIILCGTIDKIVKFKRGASAIGDYKTTSTYLVDNYFTQYRLDPQMMLYRYALEWYAKHTDDNILATIGGNRLGAFIDGIFLSKTKDTDIKRSAIMFYSDSEMEDFAVLLDEACDKIAKWCAPGAREPRKQGMFNGACTHLYGQCKFFGVCSAPDKIAEEAVIKNYFTSKPYDPLSFG